MVKAPWPGPPHLSLGLPADPWPGPGGKGWTSPLEESAFFFVGETLPKRCLYLNCSIFVHAADLFDVADISLRPTLGKQLLDIIEISKG